MPPATTTGTRRPRRGGGGAAAAAALVALLLGGPTPVAAQATTEGAAKEIPTPAPAAGGGGASAARPPAVAPITVDRQVRHPNGTQIIVASVTPMRYAITLNVSVITGPEESRLANFGMLLVDDQGGRYALVPPQGNTDLVVPKNSAMEGDLVFSGRLDPQARRLTLIVNERAGSPDARNTSSPQMRVTFDLPQQRGEVDRDADRSVTALAALEPGRLPPAEALAASRLEVDPQTPQGLAARGLSPSGGPAAGAFGAPGAAAGGLAPSGVRIVEQLRRELDVRSTPRGDVVSLPGDILFDFDRAEIRRDAEPTLRRLAQLIAETRPARVLVEGHTDSRGDDAYNQRLSERRADSVARWLSANGAPGSGVVAQGYGERRPAAPNARPNGADDPEGRQRNRRVEVVLQQAEAAGRPARAAR